MPPTSRVIIDTDPGVDDVLAILLALTATPEELEVVMISVTYGNVELQSALRNVVALFYVLGKELAWRKANGKTAGYTTLRESKPLVAIGAEHALGESKVTSDDFFGVDGLHGVHATFPDLSAETWKSLFSSLGPSSGGDSTIQSLSEQPTALQYFTPCQEVAHEAILKVLRENPVDSITIVVIGPMTNVALAAALDPVAFLRVREVIVMGGAVGVPGNVTPTAEFNMYSDPVATARVFALTSLVPLSTMPSSMDASALIKPYPSSLPRRLRLVMFPLDLTSLHLIRPALFESYVRPLIEAGSPLAQWIEHFVTRTFKRKIASDGKQVPLELHDPMTIWYVLTRADPSWSSSSEPEDLRIETEGQWTRGMVVCDRRGFSRPPRAQEILEPKALALGELPTDGAGWLSATKGNNIHRIISSPGVDACAEFLMKRIFG